MKGDGYQIWQVIFRIDLHISLKISELPVNLGSCLFT